MYRPDDYPVRLTLSSKQRLAFDLYTDCGYKIGSQAKDTIMLCMSVGALKKARLQIDAALIRFEFEIKGLRKDQLTVDQAKTSEVLHSLLRRLDAELLLVKLPDTDEVRRSQEGKGLPELISLKLDWHEMPIIIEAIPASMKTMGSHRFTASTLDVFFLEDARNLRTYLLELAESLPKLEQDPSKRKQLRDDAKIMRSVAVRLAEALIEAGEEIE